MVDVTYTWGRTLYPLIDPGLAPSRHGSAGVLCRRPAPAGLSASFGNPGPVVPGFPANHPTVPRKSAAHWLLLALVFVRIFAPFFHWNPSIRTRNWRPPSATPRAVRRTFWFGKRHAGGLATSYFNRLYGARVSLTVAFSVAALPPLAGLAIGLVSASCDGGRIRPPMRHGRADVPVPPICSPSRRLMA